MKLIAFCVGFLLMFHGVLTIASQFATLHEITVVILGACVVSVLGIYCSILGDE